MKKRITILVFICVQLSAYATGNSAVILDYIKQYRAIAVREMITYGVPASITLAQGILESGAGKSELALKSNNHFGIKCHNEWAGEKVYYDDDAANECFRKYSHPQESYHDHSLFLTTRQRYAALFALDVTDYKGWAKGLKSAGYATNPQYAELLIKLIEDYNLHEYDLMTLADVEKLEKEEGTIAYIEKNNDEKNTDKTVATKKVKAEVFYFNRIPTVIVQENDTPEKIAKAHNIYVKRVLNYNDIAINTPLEPGTHFYLQPKRYKGTHKHHTVKEGETMWSISRDEGVALDKLYSYNLMLKGEEPQTGEVLNLRKKRKDTVKIVTPESNKKTATKAETVSPPAVKDDEMEFENFNEPDITVQPEKISTPIAKPQTETSPITHEVLPKETLYSISKKYNVTVDELIAWNNLEGNTIAIGQMLIVGFK